MKRDELIEMIARTIEGSYGNNYDDLKFEMQLMAKQSASLVLHIIETAQKESESDE